MLIFSADRKKIIKATTLSVTKNFGGKKEEKWAIVAEHEGVLHAIAAVFADEKTAVDALEKAFAAFAEGARTYKFD